MSDAVPVLKGSARTVRTFARQAVIPRILFGSGKVSRLRDEIGNLGLSRVLILSARSKRQHAELLSNILGDVLVGIYDGAVMHTPTVATDQAMNFLSKLNPDCFVSIGGGSTIGLGKALVLRTGLSHIAIPTTYAGSEMTPILGETTEGKKITQRDIKVIPQVVIYDVDLTISLPAPLSIVSGMNAMAHAVEALYAKDENPITATLAENSIAMLAQSLPSISVNPFDNAARTQALYAACLAGGCLGSVVMGLHHKICHVLGGTLNLPHAETHAVLLSYVLAYNAAAAPEAMHRVARSLGATDAVAALYKFSRGLSIPASLRELGMSELQIDQITDALMNEVFWNPRTIDRMSVRRLLASAWAGDSPQAVA